MKTVEACAAFLFLSLLIAIESFALPGNPARVFTLNNGLRIIMKEQHERNLIAVNAYVMGGSRTETPDISGLSHYYEHMIFRGGTAKQAELETRKEFMGLGTFYGFTSDDVTDYYIVTTKENLDEALWRHADAVMNLELTQENVDQERQVVIEEYNMDWDRPDYRVYYLMAETAYHVHPYRVTPIGSKEVLLGSDLEKFKTFYEERYVPNQIVLACVGDFDTDELLGKIEDLWGHYPKGKESFELGLVEPEQKEFREASIEMRVTDTHMLWGFHVPGAAHPDIPALEILNTILSDGDDSRLYRALKVKDDLVLSVTSYLERRKDPSLLVLDFVLDPKNSEKTVKAVFGELERIAEEGVGLEELEAAKNTIENDYYFDHQSYIDQAQTLAFYAANSNLLIEGYYLDQVRKTSGDDIKRVAAKYLRPTNCSIATVRPEGSPLRSFSEIAEKTHFPPVSDEAPTAFPARKKVLGNGLTFINRPDYSSNTVAVEVYVKGGLLAESEEKNGICNFLAEMLLKGTADRDAAQIAERMDSLGIRLETSSQEDFSRLSMLTVPVSLRDGVDLLMEVMTRPSFPEKEISSVRADILARIRSLQDRSYDLTNKEFAAEIHTYSPYRMPVMGEESSVSKLSRKDLRECHKRLYVPSNITVVMVGSFTGEDADDFAARLAGIPEGELPVFELVEERRQQDMRTREIQLDKTQVTFDLGMMGVGVSHPDYILLKLLERVISRRLFFKYVYEEGIAYRMWTYFRPGLLATPFTFEMGVSASNFVKARDGILDEVKNVLRYGVPKEEFEAARRNLLTGIYINGETNVDQARNMAFYEMAGLGYDYLDTMKDRLDFVDLDDFNRVAGRYLTLNSHTLVVVGKVSD